jgi:hypothetical protein
MKFTGQVVRSQFIPDDPQKFGEWMAQMCEYPAVLDIGPRSCWPTPKQMAYYYGVIVAAVVRKMGYTREQVNEILKKRFLRVDIDKPWARVRGIEELSEKEMSIYIDNCTMVLQERGYDIMARSDQSLLGG